MEQIWVTHNLLFIHLDANLCSHLWSLCFTAQSLFSDYRMYAKKCTKVCPHLSVFQFANIFTQLDRRNGASFDSNNATDDQPEIISWGIDIPKRSLSNGNQFRTKKLNVFFWFFVFNSLPVFADRIA